MLVWPSIDLWAFVNMHNGHAQFEQPSNYERVLKREWFECPRLALQDLNLWITSSVVKMLFNVHKLKSFVVINHLLGTCALIQPQFTKPRSSSQKATNQVSNLISLQHKGRKFRKSSGTISQKIDLEKVYSPIQCYW